MTAALRATLVGIILASPVYAATPEKVKATLARAALAEADRKFDKALDLYLRSYLGGERTSDVRERIHDCLRQAAQTRRHRDPAFRKYVQDLSPADALNLYAEIVGKPATHPAEKDKATPGRLFTLSLQEIERALADPRFRTLHLAATNPEKIRRFVRSLKDEWTQRLPASTRESRAALQELVRHAQTDLAMSEVSPLILEAICGACGGLDETTRYIPPAVVKEQPSEATVLRAEMVDLMAGVGVIRIGRFGDSTPQEFEEAFSRLRMEGMRSLVLDLRGNTGGSLVAALTLAEAFVPGGILASTTAQVPEFSERVFTSMSGMNAHDAPLVVLVDARTMSAAEVFASAVKENNRATLIGVPTFGKGSVQAPLTAGQGKLIVTIAKVLTASGVPLNGAGVVPHVLEPDPEMQMRLAISRAGD